MRLNDPVVFESSENFGAFATFADARRDLKTIEKDIVTTIREALRSQDPDCVAGVLRVLDAASRHARDFMDGYEPIG